MWFSGNIGIEQDLVDQLFTVTLVRKGGARHLVVVGRHGQCRQQFLVETVQIAQLLGQRRELAPVVGQQKFLVAGVPGAKKNL